MHSRMTHAYTGGIKGKGKKNAAAMGRPSGASGGHGKLKKNSQFKSLKKQQCVFVLLAITALHCCREANRCVRCTTRNDCSTAVVSVDAKKKPKSGKPQQQHSGGKKSVYLSDEVRSFNERIAGQKQRGEARKQQVAAAKGLTLAPPTFVVAAPTFSLYVSSLWCGAVLSQRTLSHSLDRLLWTVARRHRRR